jgi:hypothetical protein
MKQDWLIKFINYINSSSCESESSRLLSPSKSNTITDDPTVNSATTKNKLLVNLVNKFLIHPYVHNYLDSLLYKNPFDSFQILVSTINDKVYQSFDSYNKYVNEAYERAQYLIQNKVNIINDCGLTTKEVWDSIIECLPNFVYTVITFFKEVPGISELNDNDFTAAINTRLFDFYTIQNAHLFINGESYQILFTKTKNIHYTRGLMNKIKSEDKNNILFEFAEEFNQLNLTGKEKALLIILCLTFPGSITYLRIRYKKVLLNHRFKRQCFFKHPHFFIAFILEFLFALRQVCRDFTSG